MPGKASCLFLLALAASCHQTPARQATPLVATLVGGPVRLEGSGFGVPGPGSEILLDDGAIASTSAAILSWADQAIELTLPQDARSGTITVVTPRSRTGPIPLEVYRYDFFAVPP